MNDPFKVHRRLMVDTQIRGRGVQNERILRAFEKVPRHWFVGPDFQDQAYDDYPIPIESQQTISQPYMVALMTDLLNLAGPEKILEVGTGSGYQTAILAELSQTVYSIERIDSLSLKAAERLQRLGYTNITLKVGDGTRGWVEVAPFEAILVTAGAPSIPRVLVEQLAVGGRLVIPVGDRFSQTLLRVTRKSAKSDDVQTEDFGGCRFVNLIGKFGW